MTRLFLGWFPEISDPSVLKLIKDSEIISGIELSHIDDELFRIHDAGLQLSFHQPFIPGKHWETNLANSRILEPYEDQMLLQALKLVDLDFISYHFGYSCMEIEKTENAPNNAFSPVFLKAETMQRIENNLQNIKALSGKNVIVENVDYGATGAHEHVWDPEFIGEFINRNSTHGAGFLLDISHAEITASEFGISPETYLKDVCRCTSGLVKEIHLNSPTRTTQRIIDSHDEADSITLVFLGTVLQDVSPDIIVLERKNPGLPPVDFAKKLISEAAEVRRILNKNL